VDQFRSGASDFSAVRVSRVQARGGDGSCDNETDPTLVGERQQNDAAPKQHAT
jgi:hypothetical protein